MAARLRIPHAIASLPHILTVKTMHTFFLSLLAVGAVIAIGAAVAIGVERIERAEWLKWREQAREYPAWYSTEWQRAQCEARGAPVR